MDFYDFGIDFSKFGMYVTYKNQFWDHFFMFFGPMHLLNRLDPERVQTRFLGAGI